MNKIQPFLNPLCVALDLEDKTQFEKMVDELKGVAGAFKIGPRLINQFGSHVIRELSTNGPVFVDCKYFDIPSTMRSAVLSAFEAGASVVTVHALAGKEALEEMAKIEAELQKKRPFRIIAVTILTSWSQESYPPVFETKSSPDNVLQLSHFTKKCGLGSIVCSGEELETLKDLDLFKLVPGIRLDSSAKDDQKRIMTPKQAIQKGASVLVVGRPILQAKNPRLKAEEILSSI